MRDIANDNVKTINRIVILELGGGSGRFAYQLIRALLRLTDGLIPNSLPSFYYLMTDISKSIVNTWHNQPKLKQLIEKGILELAVLDVKSPQKAELVVSKKPLKTFINGNPVVVVANYVFSVYVDTFRVEDNKLHEIKVGVNVDDYLPELVGSKEVFRKIQFNQQQLPIILPYYKESIFNAILKEYKEELTASTFQFPVTTLRNLELLKKLSKGRLFLLISDMAESNINHLEGRDSLPMYLNGPFASYVNIDAFARWTNYKSGVVLIPTTPSRHFDTYAFVLGQGGECIETSLAFENCTGMCGSGARLASIRRASKQQEKPYTPCELIGLLHSSHLDLFLIKPLIGPLLTAAAIANRDERNALLAAIEKCWDNYYLLGANDDIDYDIGRVLMVLKEPEKALKFFFHSLENYGPHHSTLYRIGRCYEHLDDLINALSYHRRSLKQKHTTRAKKQVDRLIAALENESGDNHNALSKTIG
ncbi:MAG: tetratricopeptide repeat protein [Magnetococcales bacterium]|nr:tetratricopeptide repeat protein [Magnetococcales bacterium]